MYSYFKFVWFGLILSTVLPVWADISSATNSDALVFVSQDDAAMVDLVPDPDRVKKMVDHAIVQLTGKPTTSAAWLSLVTSNDIIGIKVLSSPGPNSGTRKTVVAGIVEGLIDSGIAPTNIIIWDRRTIELRIAGYFELQRRFGVQVVGSSDTGYDDKVFYDSPLLGTLIYSDLEFGKEGKGIGRRSYLSTLLTHKITKIINVTPLIHHNVLGMTGNLYSLAMGSVDNIVRFEDRLEDLSRVIPEIWALPVKGEDVRLGDRVVLNVTDALICQYEGQNLGLLHYSTVLNQLRFSRDPVALDVLARDEIIKAREKSGVPVSTNIVDLYKNSSLLELGISNPARIKVQKVQ